MRTEIAAVLLASCAIVVSAKENKDDISRGFREDINWVPFDQAVSIAKDLNKPIFFLIHKTWCGACKNLKREFKNAPKILDLLNLSEKFVMVNVEDDDEPNDEKYAPDGGYIPRILFLDTDGNPLKTNNEKRYKNNKYFYPLVPQVIDGMERALKEFEEPSTGDSEKEAEKKEEKKDKKEKKEKKEEKKEKKEKKEDKKDEEEKKEKKDKKDDEKKKEKKEKKDDEKKEKKEKKDKEEKKEKKEKKDDDSKKKEKDEKKKDNKKSEL